MSSCTRLAVCSSSTPTAMWFSASRVDALGRHATDEQRQRRPQAFARAGQHRREHRRRARRRRVCASAAERRSRRAPGQAGPGPGWRESRPGAARRLPTRHATSSGSARTRETAAALLATELLDQSLERQADAARPGTAPCRARRPARCAGRDAASGARYGQSVSTSRRSSGTRATIARRSAALLEGQRPGERDEVASVEHALQVGRIGRAEAVQDAAHVRGARDTSARRRPRQPGDCGRSRAGPAPRPGAGARRGPRAGDPAA